MIPSPFLSLYEKHRFINLKIAFLSETKGIAPGTAQQERKLKLALNTLLRVNKYAEHYYKDKCYCGLHQQTDLKIF